MRPVGEPDTRNWHVRLDESQMVISLDERSSDG
jgi:hypothetical protein